MAASPLPGRAEPLGVIGQVQGEVFIERGSERIPVIGADRLFAGDRLVSVNGGIAEVRLTTMEAKGKPISGFLPAGGQITLPDPEGQSRTEFLQALQSEGMNFDQLPVDEFFDPVRTGASRLVLGVLGIEAGVAAVASAGRGAVGTTLEATEDRVSDKPIPGLSLTEEQANAIDSRMSESPALGAASLAFLQAAAVMSGSDNAAAAPLPVAGDAGSALPARPTLPAAAEPFRPDASAVTAMSAGAVAGQTGALDRVGDIAAAAPAVLGKEEPSERLQSELNAALGAASEVIDDAEAAALLEDVAAFMPDGNAALPDLLAALPGLPIDEAGRGSVVPAGLQAGGEMDSYNRLLKMIETFEAKISDLTGIVFNAFEGVGPDILTAKSEFSNLPTAQLLSGLSDAVNVVTREVSSLETGGSGQGLTSGLASVVSGLDGLGQTASDTVSAIASPLADFVGSTATGLTQSLSDINSSLGDVLNTVSSLTGASPGSLSSTLSGLVTDGALDLGGLVKVVDSMPGIGVQDLTSPVTGLLDQVGQVGGTLGDSVGNVVGGTVGGTVGGVVGDVTGTVGGVVGDLTGTVGGVVDGIAGGLGGTGSGSGVTGGGSLGDLVGGATGGSGAGGSVGGLAGDLLGTVGNVIDGLTGGISGGATGGTTGGTAGADTGGSSSGGGLLGNLTNNLLEGTGGLLNRISQAGADADASLQPASASASASASTGGGGDESLLTSGGLGSALSSLAGQSPIDPNQSGNTI